MPLVSVIIPTYGHGKFVLETLGSVFAQSFVDYEVIVVNDGSPDETGKLLLPLVERGDIVYIEQENAGQGAARNRGSLAASGKYLAFLDDDDLWPVNKLEWQVQALVENHDCGLVYGAVQIMGKAEQQNLDSASGRVFRDLANICFIRSPGQTLICKDVFDAVGGFDPSIWGADDWDIYLRLSRVTKFCYRPINALQYRLHVANASKNYVRLWQNEWKVIKKNIGGIPSWELKGVWLASVRHAMRSCADEGFLQARAHLDRGAWREAIAENYQALRVDPFSLVRPSIIHQLYCSYRGALSDKYS